MPDLELDHGLISCCIRKDLVFYGCWYLICSICLSGKATLVGKTKDLRVQGHYSPIQLDTALVTEGTLHDGVQGHQGDVLEDLQGGILANDLFPFIL